MVVRVVNMPRCCSTLPYSRVLDGWIVEILVVMVVTSLGFVRVEVQRAARWASIVANVGSWRRIRVDSVVGVGLTA